MICKTQLDWIQDDSRPRPLIPPRPLPQLASGKIGFSSIYDRAELPKLNKNYDRLASSVLMQWRMIVT